jgi:hypothetical protein
MQRAPTWAWWVCVGIAPLFLYSAVLQKSAGAADDPPLMRYHFETGKTCQYNFAFKVIACGGMFETNTTLDFRCDLAGSDEFRLMQIGGNSAIPSGARRANPTIVRDLRTPVAPDVLIPQFSEPCINALVAAASANARRSYPHGMAFTQTGEMISAGTIQKLFPYLLGYESQLVVETLPDAPAKTWTKKSDRKLCLQAGSSAACTAKEETNYAVQATKGSVVFLAKNYSLRSDKYDNDTTRLTMNGCGTLAFDTKMGLFRAAAMTYVIAIVRNDKVETIPLTVTYSLLDSGSLASGTTVPNTVAPQATVPASPFVPRNPRGRTIVSNRPVPNNGQPQQYEPLTAKSKSEILRDLRSTNPQIVKQAAERLTKTEDNEHPADISAALAKAMKHLDDWGKSAVLDALAIWGTDNCEEAVIEASKSSAFFVRNKALEQLGNKFKDDAAIAAIAEAFHADRHAASVAMKKIGPAGEKAMLPLLKEQDYWARCDAIGVLAEIGGERALRALRREVQSYIPRGNALEINPFNDAIAKITKRMADNPKTAADDFSKPKVRQWQDLSGTFEIEASIISVKDYKVSLKKTDGKEITVPLEKLSEDDQEYVKQYLKASAGPKPKNPFE